MEYVYVPLERQVRDRIRALKGQYSYSHYLDSLIVGGKQK